MSVTRTARAALASLTLGGALLVGGCGGSGYHGAAPTTRPASADPATAACRAGREGPEDSHAAVDYVSFVQYAGVFYINRTARTSGSPADVGPVIGHVRCKLSGLDLDAYAPLRDGDASFAAQGAAIHAVRGYPHACRIAVRQLGDLLVFSATVENTKTQRIAPCAH
jgi:hypothetical protein